MKQVDQLTALLFPDTLEITEETIDYFEQHPDELDLIISKEHFHAAYLGLFFILGLVITVASRLVAFFLEGQVSALVSDVVLDVLSELGIAIFGGAVVAYLIEYLNKKQYQQNIKFRREVKKLISQRRENQK